MPISVITETTDGRLEASDSPKSAPRCGWILYDGECSFCLSIVQRLRGVFTSRGFAFLPVQTPWVRAEFNLPGQELLAEMRLLLRNGEKFGGADAILALTKFVWWAWPVAALAHIPGARFLLGVAYRNVASRRYCIGGTCSIRVKSPGQIAREQRRA